MHKANGSAGIPNPVTERLARRRFIVGAAALSAAALASPTWGAERRDGAPSPASVTVERQGDTLHVQAQADVGANRAQTFATLADYDHLAEFVPGLASSRTLSRDGSNALVEQRGRASFGPFEQRFAWTLAIEERMQGSIRASLAGGDFRRFDAVYEIETIDAATTRVVYRAVLEPTAAIPPLVGVPVMRAMIRSQFEALMAEAARRGAAA